AGEERDASVPRPAHSLCLCRARWAWSVPGPRRGLARPRDTDGAEPVGGKPIPFSGSKASPRFWSVSRSMGSDHERPLVKVLSLSVLCTGLLLWCVFRGRTEFDERLEKEVLPGQIVDSSHTARERNAPLQLQKS
uniref:Uncharacterized protein n=1 Tax=Malurus cyaneus samueli TaxID=2593467 RepID=A0A8C5TJ08_9PASS